MGGLKFYYQHRWNKNSDTVDSDRSLRYNFITLLFRDSISLGDFFVLERLHVRTKKNRSMVQNFCSLLLCIRDHMRAEDMNDH